MSYLPLVEVLRGGLIESIHFGALAVCKTDGELIFAHGDPELKIFLRSTAKPFQALPLVETGAAEAFGLTEAELAIACASHDGADRHVEVVEGMQEKVGLSQDSLQCGAHPPINRSAAAALEMGGKEPTPNHHNCSGKHTGMLITARHMSESLESYLDPDHPVQDRIRTALCQLAGIDEREALRGTDGCSAPIYAISLRSAATAYARLAQPDGLAAERASALRRIYSAMTANPTLISGRGQIDAELMLAFGPRLAAKSGAEGILAMAIRETAGVGPKGAIIKIADGDAKRRAIPVAAEDLLRELDVLGPADSEKLGEAFGSAVRNHQGRVVGELRSRLQPR
jgi:L-asparaginase II